MRQNIKMGSVQDLNSFFSGRRILILEPHEWAHEEADFIEMVNKDGTIPSPTEKPNVNLRMKVRHKYAGDLILDSQEAFIIEKKITQNPNQN